MNPPEIPETQPAPARPKGRGIAAAIAAAMLGFFLGIVLDFVLNVGSFSFNGPATIGIGQIIVSWIVTVALGFGLYKLHHWALYGMLGAYSALFLLLLAGGILGPYTCFGTYGYPGPGR